MHYYYYYEILQADKTAKQNKTNKKNEKIIDDGNKYMHKEKSTQKKNCKPFVNEKNCEPKKV